MIAIPSDGAGQAFLPASKDGLCGLGMMPNLVL
jgi:hypothetical protein